MARGPRFRGDERPNNAGRFLAMCVLVVIISAGLRIERGNEIGERRTKPAEHLFKNMIAADTQTVPGDLHFGMAVAEMPGDACQLLRACRCNLDKILGFAGHTDQ